MDKKIMAAIVLVCMVVLYGISGLVSVVPGEVGLRIKMIGKNRGMEQETLSTGMTWVDPFSYDVVSYDSRTKQYDENLSDIPAGTKDGQPVLIDLSVEVSLLPSKIPNLHTSVGKNWYQEKVYPAIRSSIRNKVPTQLSDVIYTGAGRELVQAEIQNDMDKYKEDGINIIVNLRDIEFTNKDYIKSIEQKAIAAQNVLIAERNAEAAEKTAKGVENTAEGEKQRRIKAAEAGKQEAKLAGEGARMADEEIAKGMLAIKKSEAEGVRLRREALSGAGGKELVAIEWAKNLGPNVKVYGFPTGSPGTSSLMDLNGLMKGAFGGMSTGGGK